MAAPELVSVEFPEEETENFGFMALGRDAVLTVENALENPAGSSNLLAIANGRGLFAIAITGGFIVNQTSTLRDKFADADKTLSGLVHHIPEPVQFLTFTSDERHLIVVGQAGGMAWYFVDDLRQNDAKPRGFFRKGPLLDIKCNPRNGTSVAVLAGNRNVYHIDLPTSSLTTVSTGEASSFDWAANGQQLIVGHTDGVLTQHTVSGETLAQVPPPPDVEQKFVLFVLWIEPNRFLAIYSKPPTPGIHEYELFVVTRETNKFKFSKIFDSCPPFGLTSREGWWYSVTIRNWSREKLPYLILLASSPSIDIALMTEKHTFYLLDDTKRASLPFYKDKDTSPVGVALDLTATDRVLNPKPGVEDAAALPILWVLNNVGQVKAWNIVWGEGVAENIADVDLLREQHKRDVDSAARAPSLVLQAAPAQAQAQAQAQALPSVAEDEHVAEAKTGLAQVSITEPDGEKEEVKVPESQTISDKHDDNSQANKQHATPGQLPSQLAGSKIGFAVPSFGQKSATTSPAPTAAPATSAPSLFSQYANAPSLMQAKTAGAAPVPFSGFGQAPGLMFGSGLGQQPRMMSPIGILPVTPSPVPFGGPVFGQAGLPGPSPFGAYTNRPAFSFGQPSFGQPQLPVAVIKPPGFPVPPPPPPTANPSPFGQMANQGGTGLSPFGQLANQQQTSLFSQAGTKAVQPSTAGTAQPKAESSAVSGGGGGGAATFGARLGPARNVGPDEEVDSDHEDVTGEEGYDEEEEEDGGEEFDQEEYDENSEEYDEDYDEEYDEEDDEIFDEDEYESEVEDDEGDVTNLLAQAKVDEVDAVKPERTLSTGSLRANAKEFRFPSQSTSPSKEEPGSVAMERKSSSLRFEAPEFVFKPVSPASPPVTSSLDSFGQVSGLTPVKKSHAVVIKSPPAETKKEDVKPVERPAEEPKSVLSPTTATKLPAPTGLFAVGGTAKGEETGEPEGLSSFSLPKPEDAAEAAKPIDKPQQETTPKAAAEDKKPASTVAVPAPESTKSATPLIDVDSKGVTPAPQKPAVKIPEIDSVGTAAEEKDEKVESEETDNVSEEETEHSLLNVDEAPLNLKFATVPPPVPEYLQMSSLEEYQSKEKGLVQVFDRIYHETSNELNILRRNVSQLSKFLEAHTAQHLMRHRKEDFNEPEEWRLEEISSMTAMIDELMQEARNNNADDAKHETGLNEVAAALLKLDSKLTTAGEVLKQRSDPRYTSRLRTLALPPDALELQREIRQKMQEVTKRLDELERENTLVKSKLSAVASNLGTDMFGTAPSLEGVYKSIQRITRFAQRRAFDVSNLQKALGVVQEEIGASPRTPRLAISGNPLYKGTPESSVYAGTPARSDRDFGSSPQKLNIDEETVDELIARKKTMRKLRQFILERPECAVFTNGE
ncbi:hypothetical protein V1525DRAFT_175471 [Lipomyces kononenkoae]|uniref:Uncharacterized protein n=1 Tax=Lipomyces kononenkoae TaxID=34357 RepID=A0ACC3TAL9_LIPKO